MRNPVIVFAIATLLPVPFLALAAFLGGVWGWIALIYLTLFAFLLDELTSGFAQPTTLEDEQSGADGLLIALAGAHFALLGLAIWALSGGAGLSLGARLLTFLAFGLYFGQVSNPAAHELIHRPSRQLYTIGKWIFSSLLFGHHTSAHRLVHHVHVATPEDPNSADLGESFFVFAPRAWIGSFVTGWRAENQLRAERKGALLHPYLMYVASAVLGLVCAAMIGGWAGVLAYVALAAYATMQLLMSDYVQHYGLIRWQDTDGKPQAVSPRHSWNAPHRFTARLMLNAPRHSDHHAHPLRPYPALRLEKNLPMLPHSLPVMGFLALFPKHWRRVMDPRVAEQTSGEITPE